MAIDWDDIDLTFGVELPEFPVHDSPALSVVDDIFDMLSRRWESEVAISQEKLPGPGNCARTPSIHFITSASKTRH